MRCREESQPLRARPSRVRMNLPLQLIGVILTATAVDLLVRFGGFADFTQVLWIEAILFPLTGFALYLVFRANEEPSGFKRRLQVAAVWVFFLAGLRSGIWAAGFPVGAANLVIFLVALLAWVGLRVGKRRRGRAG